MLLLALAPIILLAQDRPPSCKECPVWNTPQQPFKIYRNTYYVGTHGLGSVLITSQAGHVLIDGALPESVPQILANIRSLGFRPEDIKLIVNSHAISIMRAVLRDSRNCRAQGWRRATGRQRS